MSFIQKNFPLVVGIALPLLIVLALVIAVFIPSALADPEYDFLFTNEGYNYNRVYRSTYEVSDSRIALKSVTLHLGEYDNRVIEEKPTIFRYSADTETVHEISFAEAETLSLDPGPSSPDGYIVEYGYNRGGGFFPFYDSGGSSGYYVTKGGARKKIPSIPSQGGYYGNGQLTFIGWVK